MDENFAQAISLVNDLYQNAFASLLQLTIALLGVSVVLVPLVLSFFQNRSLRSQNEALKEELRVHTDEKLEVLRDRLQTEIESRLELSIESLKEQLVESEDKLSKRASNAHGGVYFVQARQMVIRKQWASATKSFANAAKHFLIGGDYVSLRKSLDQLAEDCLMNSKPDSLKTSGAEARVEYLIELLESSEIHEHYADRTKKLKKALERAMSQKSSASDD